MDVEPEEPAGRAGGGAAAAPGGVFESRTVGSSPGAGAAGSGAGAAGAGPDAGETGMGAVGVSSSDCGGRTAYPAEGCGVWFLPGGTEGPDDEMEGSAEADEAGPEGADDGVSAVLGCSEAFRAATCGFSGDADPGVMSLLPGEAGEIEACPSRR